MLVPQGDFDLKPSASSNEKNLYYGVITCSLGARYKSYCANIGRTYVINPSKGMEKLCERPSSALTPNCPSTVSPFRELSRLVGRAPACKGTSF